MDENVKTVHITKPLTTARIVELLDEYPNLKVITCSPSVYKRTSDKYIEVLNRINIEVRKQYNWGAKSKSQGAEFKVLKLSNKGLKPKEIAEKLDISLNRVYYLLNKSKASFDNRNRKHNHGAVKRLKNEGLSPKQIALELDIPIRSVYYILNKK